MQQRSWINFDAILLIKRHANLNVNQWDANPVTKWAGVAIYWATTEYKTDGLVQVCSNSIANTLEVLH